MAEDRKAYMKEWRKKNADRVREYRKIYANKSREYFKEYRKINADKIKEYRMENSDKMKKYFKEYYKKNADNIKKRVGENYYKNADQIKEYQKEYNKKNLDKVKKRQGKYRRKPINKFCNIYWQYGLSRSDIGDNNKLCKVMLANTLIYRVVKSKIKYNEAQMLFNKIDGDPISVINQLFK